ncbi:PVC-type heme-binding CxxCH protein [Planctomyces sp. SH-PL14]|uniref:PVC-type heme-binding CxxCH protein n=1 Tax=Planctomyces sp. SH-PL14 TaxID=1632864 RepID=UPI00078D1F3D|nr:PVC-type heme-binding CxxCH protein [Planctomyces sp. SH-PL14]AMV22579.1 NPCBM/NEW2 domain protein [Planctomyces sp. SH-PL14]
MQLRSFLWSLAVTVSLGRLGIADDVRRADAVVAQAPLPNAGDAPAQKRTVNQPVLVNDVPATEGFTPIFDGKTLEGWRGEMDYWRVEDGIIVGEAKGKPLDHNTFLVWDQGEVDDFEIRLMFRLTGTDEKAANSGLQFRSQQLPDGHVVGYQADIDLAGNWVGALYDEHGRAVLAKRGQKTEIAQDGKRTESSLGSAEALLAKIKKGDWNEYTIIARGNHITLKVNNEVTAEVIDAQKDPGGDTNKQGERKGLFALQLHSGPPQKVEFKDIRLKRLPLAEGKKVVFVAGRPSHAPREHEHNAGCRLLAKSLEAAAEAAGTPIVTTVYSNGFPKDMTAFDNADTVVSYCDGGGGHYLVPVIKDFDKVMSRGVGLVCIHYAVEIPAGEAGNALLKWIGGYFEANWSVNPHWLGKFEKLPDHPVTRGVKPFEINDEWYYHMRFRPNMEGVTPILTALPPRETLSRPDGPHSGNPAVREAVLEKKEPQHMAWAAERADGKGRGFGFTGAHFHRNWQNDDFRKLVLNAIAWTAHAEVPKEGFVSPTPTADQLEQNLDPKGQPKKAAAAPAAAPAQAAGKPGTKAAGSTGIVSTKSEGHSATLDADITGAKQLYLVVTDGGDGFGCDWADWAEPRLVGPEGEKKLTDLKWRSGTSDFGQPTAGQNCNGGPLTIDGKTVEYGIGTHANSVVAFDLPDGHKFTRFKARCGIDDGGSRQGCGSTVQFHVFTEAPPAGFAAAKTGGGDREPTLAVAQLDVAEGLDATLFAAEPTLLSPSDIDVDHKGRVWVCEVVNYRHRSGERPEGDRILVLEDTNEDGVSDKTHVFYQGREVDTAHGICVLGNRVIVSVGDKVWNFYDDNGDLKADRKELMFSGIAGTQHDHGIHAFVFGPDGKLYFNFGNAGRQIRDKDGKPIVDKMGNEINDSRKPYQEGMVFRCDLDGSNLETLGWNFRNNWEVAVDSFGSLWQSDNDDDGNRGVRINFVMEYGNYGFKDEMTGASWQTPRTNIETEIPLRHWHLNDPGVMPNLLQTGGGAPTGICIYEGTLLPKTFQNQIIHCDAGPNVVRAYPAKPAGAGYTAEMVNILFGARDNWFRPSDACVAPDGSLIVSDWYDPGVGGHRMGDADKGRIFRVAPPKAPYKSPKYDFTTADGAVEALKSPNMEARYLAWQALHKMGADAVPALTRLAASDNPRFAARALWLLGKQNDTSKRAAIVIQALRSADSDLRIVGIRLARQLLAEGTELSEIHDAVNIHDPSPAVRRELLVGLRELKLESHPELPGAWAELASQYDGKDRWYLEALGIAADGRWDSLLDAWLKKIGNDWNTPAGRDIVWRSRATKTPGLLLQIISDASTGTADLPRYFRAFDFLTGGDKDQSIVELAFSGVPGDDAKKTLVSAEAISRLQGFDLKAKPEYKAALERVLEAKKGTVEYVKLVDKFDLKDHDIALLKLAQEHPEEQVGVEAVRSLLNRGQQKSLVAAAHAKDQQLAKSVVTAIGLAADGRARKLLSDLMNDDAAGLDVRRAAARGLGNIRQGAEDLLKLAEEKKYDPSLKDALASALSGAQWNDVRQKAAAIFPAPPSKNNEPVPPLDQLVKRNGTVAEGRVVFNTTGTCNKCHIVNGIGREIGPNLSEIGKKLSKQALFESILYPSAGISHNYESYTVVTTGGEVLTGLIVSDTAEGITLKDSNGLTRMLKQSEIEEKKKQQVSLMPADLQKLMTIGELVDVVEYLQTLKVAETK